MQTADYCECAIAGVMADYRQLAPHAANAGIRLYLAYLPTDERGAGGHLRIVAFGADVRAPWELASPEPLPLNQETAAVHALVSALVRRLPILPTI